MEKLWKVEASGGSSSSFYLIKSLLGVNLHSFIHSSFSHSCKVRGSRSKRETQKYLTAVTLSSSSWGVLSPEEIHIPPRTQQDLGPSWFFFLCKGMHLKHPPRAENQEVYSPISITIVIYFDGHTKQMPKPLQLTYFEVGVQWLYSQLLTLRLNMTPPWRKHILDAFGPIPYVVNKGEGWNIDGAVNWKLCLTA